MLIASPPRREGLKTSPALLGAGDRRR